MIRSSLYFPSKIFVVVLTLSSFFFKISAQPLYSRLYDKGTFVTRVSDATATKDGGVLYFSESKLTKLDCFGNVEWLKEIENSNDSPSRGYGDVVEEENGDIMISFTVRQPGLTNFPQYYCLMKMDKMGNVLWEKIIGQNNKNQRTRTLLPTQDKGFIISGTSFYVQTQNEEDFYFAKTDSLGNIEWGTAMGDDGYNNYIEQSVEDAQGNSYHIGENVSADTLAIRSFFIVKVTPNGEVAFHKSLSNPNYRNINLRDAVLTPNGNLLSVGWYQDGSTSRSLLIKTNSLGEIIYSKNINVLPNDAMIPVNIIRLNDSSYALAGFTTEGSAIITLDGNENLTSGKVYDFPNAASISTKKLHYFSEKPHGGFNLLYTKFPPTSIFVAQLGEDLSSACGETDITDELYFTDDSGWEMQDIPFTTLPWGTEQDFPIIINDIQYDSITTLCIEPLAADFSLENPCANEPLRFNDISAGGVLRRAWNFDNGAFISQEKNPVYDFSSVGTFPVQLIVSNGCEIDTLYRVVEILPTTITETDSTVCSGRPMYFHNNIFTEVVTEEQIFVYTDTLVNVDGCDSIDVLEVLVRPCPCEVLFPNAFTPNGDGVNDTFSPVLDCNFELGNYELRLYNRWGQLVFQAQNPTEEWDGTFQNQPLPMDVLVYQVQYQVMDMDGTLIEERSGKGEVTLIR